MVCPISDGIFRELMRQSDEYTRTATAELIDCLSGGVSIEPLYERIGLEVLCFLRSQSHSSDEMHAPADLVWTKVAYTFGASDPIFPGIRASQMLAIQKATFDFLWNASLVEIVAQIGENHDFFDDKDAEQLVRKLNRGKFENPPRTQSFHDLLLDELAGTLDASAELLASVMNYLYESETGSSMTAIDLRSVGKENLLGRMIYNVIRLKGVRENEFATFRVYAGIHAAIRWDRLRKYKTNDLLDFDHAAAALPYFNVFFTEGSLHHLVTSGKLGFNELFNVQVASNVADAIRLLHEDH